jgi:hypothetical protein
MGSPTIAADRLPGAPIDPLNQTEPVRAENEAQACRAGKSSIRLSC